MRGIDHAMAYMLLLSESDALLPRGRPCACMPSVPYGLHPVPQHACLGAIKALYVMGVLDDCLMLKYCRRRMVAHARAHLQQTREWLQDMS